MKYTVTVRTQGGTTNYSFDNQRIAQSTYERKRHSLNLVSIRTNFVMLIDSETAKKLVLRSTDSWQRFVFEFGIHEQYDLDKLYNWITY